MYRRRNDMRFIKTLFLTVVLAGLMAGCSSTYGHDRDVTVTFGYNYTAPYYYRHYNPSMRNPPVYYNYEYRNRHYRGPHGTYNNRYHPRHIRCRYETREDYDPYRNRYIVWQYRVCR